MSQNSAAIQVHRKDPPSSPLCPTYTMSWHLGKRKNRSKIHGTSSSNTNYLLSLQLFSAVEICLALEGLSIQWFLTILLSSTIVFLWTQEYTLHPQHPLMRSSLGLLAGKSRTSSHHLFEICPLLLASNSCTSKGRNRQFLTICFMHLQIL